MFSCGAVTSDTVAFACKKWAGYDSPMLPRGSEPGRRFAAVLPSLMESLGYSSGYADHSGAQLVDFKPAQIAVLIVVDGLGWSNLSQRSAHARFLWSQPKQRIETVRPSTTGAALTTLLTGELPGEHGLVGYRIRDRGSNRFRSTLNDWDGILDMRSWQRAEPLMSRARDLGMNPVAIGRKAHESSGLTRAILHGASYVGAQSIEERMYQAARYVHSEKSQLIYVYIDELDRAGHVHGWQSDQWLAQLEEVDLQVRQFVEALPKTVGCVLTADHGMVDVPFHKQVLMDEHPPLLSGVAHIAGEPRMRYLYLAEPSAANTASLVETWREKEQKRANVWSREEVIATGIFGNVAEEVFDRIGDVVIAAKGGSAYYTSALSDAQSRQMVGQHGGVSDDELGIPLIRFGAYA